MCCMIIIDLYSECPQRWPAQRWGHLFITSLPQYIRIWRGPPGSTVAREVPILSAHLLMTTKLLSVISQFGHSNTKWCRSYASRAMCCLSAYMWWSLTSTLIVLLLYDTLGKDSVCTNPILTIYIQNSNCDMVHVYIYNSVCCVKWSQESHSQLS